MDKNEINRKIAEIMGWELRPFPGGSGRVAWCQYFADIDRWIWHCDENDLPDYATNIAQAFGVVNKMRDNGKLTEATIGFDFDEVSKDCPMKDPTFKYEACDLIKHRNTDVRYPFRNDCNEANCILMHLLRVIGPMLIK